MKSKWIQKKIIINWNYIFCAEKDKKDKIVTEYLLEGLNNYIYITYCIRDKEQLIKEVEKVLKENKK